jgi:3-carboxy-cis,cis-muconate cycloisomerase
MAATVFDSAIFCDTFAAPAMRHIFSDAETVARYVDVEVALAQVEARLGIIPAAAAEDIKRRADARGIDLAELRRATNVVGYPIVGLVAQLAKQCGEAGRYLHWGATTQDIMDTAVVLQMRAALALVDDGLARIGGSLTALAKTYRSTLMPGRTHLQHALPITFGYKAAVWLSPMLRHRQRLKELSPRLLVGQFAGAAGTLASLGDKGLAVHDALMAELGLGVSEMPWHVARDSVAETVSLLGLITGSLGKIATDVALLMQTEVGEAFEPFQEGRGSSSTMPQKRNPIGSELIIAAARIVRQHAGLMLDGMAADHERATGPWQLEWMALPEAFLATGAALGQAREMLDGLIVVPERMRRNLDLTGGQIVAEAVMMALAEHTGRQRAHHIVAHASRAALEKATPLLAELEADPEVSRHLDGARLRQLTDPANYLGSALAMVDRLLARAGDGGPGAQL